MVFLGTDQGQIAVSADRIVRVDFKDKEPAAKYEKKSSQVRLDISLEEGGRGTKDYSKLLSQGSDVGAELYG